jgi:hypothetical protein
MELLLSGMELSPFERFLSPFEGFLSLLERDHSNSLLKRNIKLFGENYNFS